MFMDLTSIKLYPIYVAYALSISILYCFVAKLILISMCKLLIYYEKRMPLTISEDEK